MGKDAHHQLFFAFFLPCPLPSHCACDKADDEQRPARMRFESMLQ